jgi:uncharacterized protein YecE (DUF72 family)
MKRYDKPLRTGAMAACVSIRIGCAGWSYRDWVGPVYPPKSGPEDWLALYATLFSTVEVDATFYAIPARTTVAGWIRKSESLPDFTFSAKVPQDATHRALPDSDLAAARQTVDIFLETVVAPLEDAKRFETAVVQLPPFFAATKENGDPLADLVGLVEALGSRERRVAVEFRHRSWFSQPGEVLIPEAQAALADLGAAVARIDGLGSTFTATRTTTWSYVRLHGRRASIPAAERGESWAPYNYLYSDEEMKEIEARIRGFASEDTRTTVIFNNHYEGKAAKNATDLMERLTAKRIPLPAAPPATKRLEEFF